MMYQADQIESYLKNELSLSDKAIFEEMLRRDPLLQNEVHFQEAVIGGVQQFRKDQLKARLNNVSIDSASNTSNYKVAALTLAGILTVGIGGWYVADQNSKAIKTTPQAINNIRTDHKKLENTNTAKVETTATETDNLPKQEKKFQDLIQNTTVIPKHEVRKENSKPFITDTDTIDKEEDLQKHDQIKLPTGDIAPVASKNNLGVKVSVNNSSSYKFHYSFTDSKLFLYGDFSQLYEILDFNTKEGKQLYIFYQNSFYKINENQSNIVPLIKVNNPQMIKKLNEAKEQAQK